MNTCSRCQADYVIDQDGRCRNCDRKSSARRSAAACSPFSEGDTAPEQWISQCLVARIRRDEALTENAEMRAILYEVSTGGYTPMQAHEWLKSHPQNADATNE